MPPEIRYSDPSQDDTLVLNLDTNMAYVLAFDADADSLSFVWTIQGLADQGTAEPFLGQGLTGSKLTLSNDPLFDGRTLTCLVIDPAGDTDQRSWQIQVVEAR